MTEKAGQSSEKHWRYRRFLRPPAGDSRFAVDALGLEEWMAPGMVDRPDGTGDYFLLFFPPGLELRDRGGVRQPEVESGIFFAADSGHYYGAKTQPWLHSWLHVSGTCCRELAAASGVVLDQVLPVSFRAVGRHLSYLMAELSRPGAVHPRILEHGFAALLLELARGREETIVELPEPIRRARRRIERDYRSELTLAQLAREACWSVSHLSAEFRRACGISPIAYLLQLRLREGAYLLRDRNLSVAAIARQLGFADPFYFSRLFRRRYGLSPSDYRKRG